jgi:hypothetical protein
VTYPHLPRKAHVGAHTSGSRAQTFAALTPTHRPRRCRALRRSSVALRLRRNEFQRLANRNGCRGEPCFAAPRGRHCGPRCAVRPRGPNRCSGAPLRARCRGLAARRCRCAATLSLARLRRVKSRYLSRGQTWKDEPSPHPAPRGCRMRLGGTSPWRARYHVPAHEGRHGLAGRSSRGAPPGSTGGPASSAGLQPLGASARSRGAKRPSSRHSHRFVNYPQERVFRSFP